MNNTKIFIKNNIKNNIVYFDGTNWIDSGLIEPLNENQFLLYGMSATDIIPQNKWDELDDSFELLCYTPMSSQPILSINTINTYMPINILSNPILTTYILSNKNCYINLNVVADNEVKFLLSNDKKNTWWTYDTVWRQVNLNQIKTDGIKASNLTNITPDKFKQWFKRGYLDFAIWMQEQSNDINLPYIQSLIVNFPQNQPPVVNSFNIYPNVVNRNKVVAKLNVTEQEGDLFRIRIIVNDNILNWSDWYDGETINTVLYDIDYQNFSAGNNVIVCQLQDNRMNHFYSIEKTVQMINHDPLFASFTYDDFSVTGVIMDDDNDPIRYRVLINNVQVYPTLSDPKTILYTDYIPVPYNFSFIFNSKNINIGTQNNITIEILDKFNGSHWNTFNINGKYNNLMLKDSNQNYLSNDCGELIKYLNIGKLTNGNKCSPQQIIIENEYNYPIKNVTISTVNPNSDYQIVLSDTSDFNMEYNSLLLNTIQIGESKSFYIKTKINDIIKNYGESIFKIIVTGNK